MTKFSVIIPLYNGAKYITAALNSVASQTFRDFEIVICDDGSTDNSADIVKEYSGSHPELKIKYAYQKNKGLGGARNTAMRNAEGEIFALLDQDDIWYPHKLERVSEVFEKENADIVCNQEDVISNGNKVSVLTCDVDAKNMFRRLLFKGNCLSTSATGFKREIFEKVGPFSEDICNLHFVEDYDYWMRIAMKGYKFSFVRQSLGQYILHKSNYSSNNQEMMCNHTIFVIKKNFAGYKEKSMRDRILLNIRMSSVYLFYSRTFFSNKKTGLFLKYLILSFAKNPIMPFVYFVKKIASAALNKTWFKKPGERFCL